MPLTAKQIQKLTACSKATSYRWLSDTKFDPSNEETVLAYARQKELDKTTGPDIGATDLANFDPKKLPDVGDKEGAAAALKRLQTFEKQSAQQLQAANDSGDAVQIKRATQAYATITSVLMKYETLVSAHQRDIGSLISRQEALEFVKNFCTGIRLGMNKFAGSDHIEQIRMADDNRAGKAVAISGMISGVSGAFKNSMSSSAAVPPDFALLAIQELRLSCDSVTDPQNPGWHILHYSDNTHGHTGWVKVERGIDKETVLPATQEEIARALENAVASLPDETE
jgi:hypothetical protein